MNLLISIFNNKYDWYSLVHRFQVIAGSRNRKIVSVTISFYLKWEISWTSWIKIEFIERMVNFIVSFVPWIWEFLFVTEHMAKFKDGFPSYVKIDEKRNTKRKDKNALLNPSHGEGIQRFLYYFSFYYNCIWIKTNHFSNQKAKIYKKKRKTSYSWIQIESKMEWKLCKEKPIQSFGFSTIFLIRENESICIS